MKNLVLGLALLSILPVFANASYERRSLKCELVLFKTAADALKADEIGKKEFEILVTFDSYTRKTVDAKLISDSPLPLQIKYVHMNNVTEGLTFYHFYYYSSVIEFKNLNHSVTKNLIKEFLPVTDFKISSDIKFSRLSTTRRIGYWDGVIIYNDIFRNISKVSTIISGGNENESIIDFQIACDPYNVISLLNN